jgi:hypothetical protein
MSVSHETDDTWQVVCANDHSEPDPGDGAKVIAADHLLDLDSSLASLPWLGHGHVAWRAAVGEPWTVHDLSEDVIREHVDRYGWHVALVPAQPEAGRPPFAHTIGLHRTFGAPEVICFGLDLATLHALLNLSGEALREGRQLELQLPFEGILSAYPVTFQPVDSRHLPDHLGYAIWFHECRPFPVLQLVWPDQDGRFPWDPNCAETTRSLQPRLYLDLA